MLHLKNSVATWVPQASWNGDDTLDGSGDCSALDPTKLNHYEISYRIPGRARFYIECQETGRFTLVHDLLYQNQNTTPFFKDHILYLLARSENHANTSNLTVKVSEMGGYVDGKFDDFQVTVATAIFVASVGTSETPILTIRNPATWQSTTNRVSFKLIRVNIATTGNKDVEIRGIVNGSLTGASFDDINTNVSPVEVDDSASAVSGGVYVGGFVLSGGASEVIDVIPAFINPEDAITLTARTTVSGTSDVFILAQFGILF